MLRQVSRPNRSIKKESMEVIMTQQNGDVKPIETYYNGYRFRSRLEARWAILFDAMGWPYEYEPEGYDLGKAGWYLPDFWIPICPKNNFTGYTGAGYFIEIKGNELTKNEKKKVAALSYYSKHTVRVFVGTPWNFKRITCQHKKIKSFLTDTYYAEMEDGREPGIRYGFEIEVLDSQLGYDEMKVRTAKDAMSLSKKARFEHGETPNVGGGSHD